MPGSVVITGGGRGVGAATARVLIAKGLDVTVLDLTAPDWTHDRLTVVLGDASDPGVVARAADAAVAAQPPAQSCSVLPSPAQLCSVLPCPALTGLPSQDGPAPTARHHPKFRKSAGASGESRVDTRQGASIFLRFGQGTALGTRICRRRADAGAQRMPAR